MKKGKFIRKKAPAKPVVERLRDQFIAALAHLGNVMVKIAPQSGTATFLLTADRHTIAEGLFLYAFTHWEEFTRDLLIEDVATNNASTLHRAVQKFRDRAAHRRLAIRLLQHPDHPRRFVEWSNYDDIVSRANEFVGASSRFAAPAAESGFEKAQSRAQCHRPSERQGMDEFSRPLRRSAIFDPDDEDAENDTRQIPARAPVEWPARVASDADVARRRGPAPCALTKFTKRTSSRTMADHLQKRLFLKDGDVVEVESDTQANVRLMDDSDYSSYQAGQSHHYYGGFFTQFPARLSPPHSGYWNVVLDLGGGRATVRHSIRVLNRAA